MYAPAHFFAPNELRRYSLGTKNKSLRYDEDGATTLIVSVPRPDGDDAANWLPAPDGPLSLYLRAYGGRPRAPTAHGRHR